MYPLRSALIHNGPVFLGQQTSAEASDAMAKEMKEEAIKAAAAQAAITIALNFVPVIGSVLSLAASALFKSQMDKYQGMVESEMNKVKAELEAKGKEAQDAINKRTDQIYAEELPVAQKEIMTFLNLEGLGGWGSIKKAVSKAWSQVKSEAERAHDRAVAEAKRVAEQIKKAEEEARAAAKRLHDNMVRETQRAIDTVRGKQYYTEAMAKLRELRAAGLYEIAQMRKKGLEDVNKPAFRANLREEIKSKLLQDPTFLTSLEQKQAAPPIQKVVTSSGPTVNAPQLSTPKQLNTNTYLLVGGAIAAGFFLLR